MKNLLFLLSFLTGTTLFAQQKGDHSDVDIRTNAICGMCKKTIETELLYEKGVKTVSADLGTNVIHVDYDEKKTDPAKLRAAVAKLGYAADDLAPNEEARKDLPACCRNEGCGMPAGKH